MTSWRMDELVTHAVRLAELLPEGDSKRVRWSPNERLLRYYTTLGLLDRPAAMKGRTAYYGPRHLLQVLAVKTLQSQGLSLHEVQQQLTGRTDGELVALSGLPSDYLEHLTPPARRTRFWEQAPAEPALAPAPAALPALLAFELVEGVQLILDPQRYPGLTPEQLRQAAGPLLDLLQQTREEHP